MNLPLLKEYGFDYEKGINRCLGDSDLYSTILTMFLNDTCLERAHIFFSEANYTELFDCMHELKGVCGNAEILNLYNVVCPLVDLLRNPANITIDVIKPLFEKVDIEYNKAIEGITLAMQ